MCWCVQISLQLAEASIGPSAAGHDGHLEWHQEEGGHLDRGAPRANLALKRASKFLVGGATGRRLMGGRVREGRGREGIKGRGGNDVYVS